MYNKREHIVRSRVYLAYVYALYELISVNAKRGIIEVTCVVCKCTSGTEIVKKSLINAISVTADASVTIVSLMTTNNNESSVCPKAGLTLKFFTLIVSYVVRTVVVISVCHQTPTSSLATAKARLLI